MVATKQMDVKAVTNILHSFSNRWHANDVKVRGRGPILSAAVQLKLWLLQLHRQRKRAVDRVFIER